MSPLDQNIDAKLKRSRKELSRNAVDFLSLDIETAFTFINVARTATEPEKKLRNQDHARRAYDKVGELAKRLPLSPEQYRHIAEQRSKLKAELETLGERF